MGHLAKVYSFKCVRFCPIKGRKKLGNSLPIKERYAPDDKLRTDSRSHANLEEQHGGERSLLYKEAV